jgi:para-nitrobenzyl esterase
VRDADAFGPACLQSVFLGDAGAMLLGDEDCLTLNVWAPADGGTNRPVLFFVHGGGNQSGSASVSYFDAGLYEGGPLAAHEGVVVVTTQYRLGALGFLARAALQSDAGVGNYGLLDQQAALAWVRDNVAAFGGDPRRVMLFGESAGALDVCAHLASPGSAGLFSAAGVQSGGCTALDAGARSAQADDVVLASGCADAGDEAACLRAVDAGLLFLTEDRAFAGGIAAPKWGATIDGVTLREPPLEAIRAGRGNKVPLLVGSNADEAALTAPLLVTAPMLRAAFAQFPTIENDLLQLYPDTTPRLSFIAAATDGQFTCNARRLARAATPHQPVYRYFFDHHLPTLQGAYLGAFHGVELFYVFRALERSSFGPSATSNDRLVMDFVGASWGSFASTGDVNGSGRPLWPRSSGSDELMIIAPLPIASNDVRGAKCDVWDRVSP